MFFVIIDVESLNFLSRICVGASPWISTLGWTESLKCACHFITHEEAQLTIDFLVNVLDAGTESQYKIFRTG